MRCAIIDIGSNTVHMCIYEYGIAANRFVRKIANRCEAIGLLCDILPDNRLSEIGISKILSAIQHLSQIASFYHCDSMYFFATAVLRHITNCNQVIEKVYETLGVRIEVLSGAAEAMLSFSGLQFTFGRHLRSGIMVDMGGGSTEFLCFENGKPKFSASLPFGSLSLYRDFVSGSVPTVREMVMIGNYVRAMLDSELSEVRHCNATLYAIGGTARTLCKLSKIMAPMSNFRGKTTSTLTVTPTQICTLYRMIEHPDDMLLFLQTAVPDRLTTISPGIIAYHTILEYIDVPKIVVSTGGIREGYLKTRVLPDTMRKGKHDNKKRSR